VDNNEVRLQTVRGQAELDWNAAEAEIHCIVFSDKNLDMQEQRSVPKTIKRALRVEEDLSEFYLMSRRDEILHQPVEDLCGMRTPTWPELFSALILAVTLQMAPMKRSDQMMDLLIENFGDEACFDGRAIA
jgi:3-methyladenine DNA glycosylase/8-oxoguanine DNA glycosylase